MSNTTTKIKSIYLVVAILREINNVNEDADLTREQFKIIIDAADAISKSFITTDIWGVPQPPKQFCYTEKQ